MYIDATFYLFCGSYIPWHSARHIVHAPEIYDQVMDYKY